MKNISRLFLLAASLVFAPVLLRAGGESSKPAQAAAKLDTGSKAPEFKPTAWVQGEPVKAFEPGKVYLVECWAIWCAPCVEQIPHLNALHKKYAGKGLVVIGTDVWDGGAANTAAFVKRKGDGMSYRVVYDDAKSGQVTREWLGAAGVNGIPHAFVVRDGIIIWHGHPGGLDDGLIELMLSGKYDYIKVTSEWKAREKAEAELRSKVTTITEEIRSLTLAKNFDGALKKADELAALDASLVGVAALQRVSIFSKKGDVTSAIRSARDAVRADGAFAKKYDLTVMLLKDKVIIADKTGAAFVVELADSLAKDPEQGDRPLTSLLCAQAHYAAGDKAGALAALRRVSGWIDDRKANAYADECTAAVNAGAAWPARPSGLGL
jgi:thiol-disulfide isomerase/thioredoxin